MRIEVNIEPESVDSIVQNELKWHYMNAKYELKKYKKLKKLEKHQQKDKEYLDKLFPALKAVCNYYGVKTS